MLIIRDGVPFGIHVTPNPSYGNESEMLRQKIKSLTVAKWDAEWRIANGLPTTIISPSGETHQVDSRLVKEEIDRDIADLTSSIS